MAAENEKIKFFKGAEEKIITENDYVLENGSIYYCEDTKNTYIGKNNALSRFSSAVGQTVLNNNGQTGEIFNDYDNNTASGNYSHAEGQNTSAQSDAQHVQGKYNLIDNENEYAHIVGNGSSNSSRSNAHTLDWDGNAWFAGDVYVGIEESKKLVDSNEFNEHLENTNNPHKVERTQLGLGNNVLHYVGISNGVLEFILK